MKRNTMELTGTRLKAAENWYKRQVKNGTRPHCVIDSTGCNYLFCGHSAIRWYGSMLPVEENIGLTDMEKNLENIFFLDIEREEENISIETLKSKLDCAKAKAGLSTKARFDTQENYHAERLIAWKNEFRTYALDMEKLHDLFKIMGGKNFKLYLPKKSCTDPVFIKGTTNSMDAILMPVRVNK